MLINSNPNATNNFAHWTSVLFLINIIAIPAIATIGRAKAVTENSPNHNQAMRTAVVVVPILAPIITPIALVNSITPAPTNQIRRIETRPLLCNKDVIHVPVKTDIHAVLV